MRKTLSLLIVLLAACSGSGSEGPLLTFADFNNPPTTPEVLSGSSTTTVTTSPPPTTTTSTSTTLLIIDTPSAVAVTDSSGYSILEDRGAPRRLIDGAVVNVFDDLQGGFVFQLPGAGTDPAADQRIYWSRAANSEAQPRLDVIGEGGLLKLWGIERIDGSPQMILTIVDDADDPVERIERLVVFDFETGDRVLGEVGTAESGPVAIGYGGGRFVLEQLEGVQTLFEFRNDQGAVIDLASNPHPGCADDPTCPTDPAIDPSGSFLAYVEADTSGEVDLVIHDLDLGEEIRRIPLPGKLGTVLGLDFDGTTVLVNRVAPDGAIRAIIVDTNAQAYGEFGLTGVVQFLRQGPGFEGPIEVPSG